MKLFPLAVLIFIVVFFVAHSTLSSAEIRVADERPIIFNEFAIVPDAPSHPRWIELRNISYKPVDLGGWTLRDSGGVLHQFKEGEGMEPGALLMLLFYRDLKRRDVAFEKTIPEGVRTIVIKTNNPFGRRFEFDLERFKRDVQATPEEPNNDMLELYENLEGENYPAFSKKAEELLRQAGLPETYKSLIMGCLWHFYPFCDELALFNSDGDLVAYVSWGMSYQPDSDFQWEQVALQAGLIPKRRRGFIFHGPTPDSNAYNTKNIVLEKDRGGMYRRRREGSPGTLQRSNEPPAFCKVYPGRIDVWSSSSAFYDTVYRSFHILQFSNYENFSEISYIAAINDPTWSKNLFKVDQSFYLMGMDTERTYYRMVRVLVDGSFDMKWSGRNVIYWRNVCKHFGVDSVNQLIMMSRQAEEKK